MSATRWAKPPSTTSTGATVFVVRARAARWRRRRPLLLAVAAALVVLGFVVFAYAGPALVVRTVQVTGVSTGREAQVRAAAAVPVGRPLARIDTAVIAAQALIDEERSADGPAHETIVFAYLGVDGGSPAAAAALEAAVAAQADWLGAAVSEVFVAAGATDTAADAVRSLWDAGAHTVVLRAIGDDPLGRLRPVLAALGR